MRAVMYHIAPHLHSTIPTNWLFFPDTHQKRSLCPERGPASRRGPAGYGSNRVTGYRKPRAGDSQVWPGIVRLIDLTITPCFLNSQLSRKTAIDHLITSLPSWCNTFPLSNTSATNRESRQQPRSTIDIILVIIDVVQIHSCLAIKLSNMSCVLTTQSYTNDHMKYCKFTSIVQPSPGECKYVF